MSDVTEFVAPNEDPQPATDKAYNFARLRQEKEQLERELAETRAALRPEPEEVDELADLDPEDWTTGRQSQILAERHAKKAVQEALEKDRREREEERKRQELKELPTRLRKELPNFQDVVSDKNIEYLREHKPYIYAALDATPDPYAQAKAVYDACEAFCPSPEVEKEKAAIVANSKRPGSLDAVAQPGGVQGDPRRWTSGEKERRFRSLQDRAKQR